MVHVRSKYNIDVSQLSVELMPYWFGYLRARGYMFKGRDRIRCRAPLSDMGHLFQLCKDLGTVKTPRKTTSGLGDYAQLIIDSKRLCDLLRKCGWHGLPNDKLDSRHVIRGLLDGGGSISRNGTGIQVKYLRIAFGSKNHSILKWTMSKLGKRSIVDNRITWVGGRAVEIAKELYLHQSRYLDRKFKAVSPFIFGRPLDHIL